VNHDTFYRVFSTYFFCREFINVYTLYFDGIDDEYVGFDFTFSPGYSQYLAFSFDGGGLDDDISFVRSIFSIYIFLLDPYFIVTEAYD